MSSATVEKTAEELRKEIAELRKEIAELQRQQWEITERLRDPRGIRRSGAAAGPPVQPRKRGGVARPAAELEDQPAVKRRLSSAVVKLEDGEIEDAGGSNNNSEGDAAEMGIASTGENNKPRTNPQRNSGFRSNGSTRMRKMDYDALPTEPVPRVLPKDEDPSLVKHNRRMLGQPLGTLEKSGEEDNKLSTTEAFMRRSDSLRRDMAGGYASMSTTWQVLHTRNDMPEEIMQIQRSHCENIAAGERSFRDENPKFSPTQTILPLKVESTIMQQEFPQTAVKGRLSIVGSYQSSTSSKGYSARGGFYYSREAEEIQRMQQRYEELDEIQKKLKAESQYLCLRQQRFNEVQRQMMEQLAQLSARVAGPSASQGTFWQIRSQTPECVPTTYPSPLL